MNLDQTSNTIDTIKSKLENLKTVLDYPKYYLSNFFSDLKHEIDCTFAKLILQSDETKRSDLKSAWLDTIQKVDSFEIDCFKNLPKLKLDDQFRLNLNTRIKSIEKKLNKSSLKNLDKCADLIDLEQIQLEKSLFLNQTVIFMDLKKCKETSLFNEFFLSKLTFITDEYLSRQGIETILNNKLYPPLKGILTNEKIKLKILKSKIITSNTDISEMTISTDSIGELYLSSNKIDSIHIDAFKGFNNLQKLLLDNNNLTYIDPNAFQYLSNLQVLYLYNNKLRSIDANMFKGLSGLKKLWLHCNHIASIDGAPFQYLTSLQCLFLSNNHLTNLGSKSFQGLSNLQWLSLCENQLVSIEKSTFKDLVSLEGLNLRRNPLLSIKSELFQDLINLKILWLDKEQIELIDEKTYETVENYIKD